MRNFRFVGLLATILGMPSLTLAGYGLDEVPNSTFSHNHDWRHYGTDLVPQTRKHLAGMPTTYGLDQIPGEFRLRQEDPHHVLMMETIQYLTGAVEVTPSATPPKNSRAANPGRRILRPRQN